MGGAEISREDMARSINAETVKTGEDTVCKENTVTEAENRNTEAESTEESMEAESTEAEGTEAESIEESTEAESAEAESTEAEGTEAESAKESTEAEDTEVESAEESTEAESTESEDKETVSEKAMGKETDKETEKETINMAAIEKAIEKETAASIKNLEEKANAEKGGVGHSDTAPKSAVPGTQNAPEHAQDNASGTKEAGGEAAEGGRKRKGKAVLVCCLILIPLVILLGAGGWFYFDSLAYKVCRVEAGVQVAPSDFLKQPDEEAYFADGSQPFDITQPGEYLVKVKSGFFTHNCTLIIQDTIAPQAEVRQVRTQIGEACEAEEFVTGITDATAVTISYAADPDFSKPGVQSVQVLLEDLGHNQTILQGELLVTQVVEYVAVEAGAEAPGLEDFVIGGQEAEFITNIEEIDTTQLGKHEIQVKSEGEIYSATLEVVDTIPPKAEVHDVTGYALAPRSAEEFITSVEDVTEVTAAFKEEPDLTKIGTQEVTILFTDAGKNETLLQAMLTLEEDTEAPVIKGAGDLSVFVGDAVSYRKNVSVTDNCPEGVELSVDTSGVNLEEAGVYPITYTAKDLAGNTSSVTVNLMVNSRSFDPAEVYALADSILAEILTEDMTPLEKVTAIYDYIKGHVGYVSHSEKGDWLKAAYDGLTTGRGDCYTYASTSKLLLTQAGIANMDIAKIPAKSNHVWNLVDIGDGWYHFDTCPRRGLTEKILMWTDEKLMEYSESHNKSHNYDHSAYPEVN